MYMAKQRNNVKIKKKKETWFNKHKKIIAIASAVLLVVALALVLKSCIKKEHEDETVLAKYTACMYQVDQWKVENEDGTRDYFTTFLLYSDDYYDEPTVDDIKYLTNDGYEILESVVEDSEVTIYTMNSTVKEKVCTYVKIKTKKMLDEQKVYASIAGPTEYDAEISSKEDYIEKYGSDEGWRALMVCVTTYNVPTTTVSAFQPNQNEGVVHLVDEDSSSCYYKMSNEGSVIEGNSILRKVEVDPLSENGTNAFIDTINASYAAKVIDGEITVMENLDENIQIVCKVIGGEVWLGFELADGTNWSDYHGETPEMIIFSLNEHTYCFTL